MYIHSFRAILVFVVASMTILACTSESSTSLTQSADHQESASIKGTVLEAGWDEPAVGATITIEAKQLVTTTDMFGSFELKGVPLGEHQLVATYMNQADTLNLVVKEGENPAKFKLHL